MSLKIEPFKEISEADMRAAYNIGIDIYRKNGVLLDFPAWKKHHSKLYDGKYEQYLVRNFGSAGTLEGYLVITDRVSVNGHTWTKMVEIAGRGFTYEQRVLRLGSMIDELKKAAFTEFRFGEVKYSLDTLCSWLHTCMDMNFFHDEALLRTLVDAFLSEHKVSIQTGQRGLLLCRDSMGRQNYITYPMSDYRV
ncbi:hypothetical protein HYY69_00965 [Candidatus Woesearchaeota archaeon]|nr:hypothetical protein [Candidatus Woesearchaeota archaeon]